MTSVFSDHRSAPLAVDRATLSPRRSGPRHKQRHFHAVKMTLESADKVANEPSFHLVTFTSVPGAIAPLRGSFASKSTCARIAWFSCTSICPQRSSPKVHRSASISPVSAGNCPSSQCVNASADCRIGWYSSRAIPSSGLGVRVTFGGIISASFFINGERLSNIEPSRSHNNITTMPCPVNGGF